MESLSILKEIVIRMLLICLFIQGVYSSSIGQDLYEYSSDSIDFMKEFNHFFPDTLGTKDSSIYIYLYSPFRHIATSAKEIKVQNCSDSTQNEKYDSNYFNCKCFINYKSIFYDIQRESKFSLFKEKNLKNYSYKVTLVRVVSAGGVSANLLILGRVVPDELILLTPLIPIENMINVLLLCG